MTSGQPVEKIYQILDLIGPLMAAGASSGMQVTFRVNDPSPTDALVGMKVLPLGWRMMGSLRRQKSANASACPSRPAK